MYEKLKALGLEVTSVLDIGANIGEFTTVCSRYIWPEAKYVMIEANKKCEESLKKVGHEYYIDVLGTDDGKDIVFYMTKENETGTGNSTYKENTRHYSNDKLIEEHRVTRKLDTLLGDKEFDLIKMDTQGSELDIIIGGESIIKKARYVLIEASLVEYNIGAPKKNDIIEHMKSIGFNNFMNIADHVYGGDDASSFRKGQVIQQDILFFKD